MSYSSIFLVSKFYISRIYNIEKNIENYGPIQYICLQND